jgi:hypothetical protein
MRHCGKQLGDMETIYYGSAQAIKPDDAITIAQTEYLKRRAQREHGKVRE